MRLVLFLGLACVPLRAALFELDQGFDSGPSGGNAVLVEQRLFQTFTVGIEGSLGRVDLNMFEIGNATSGVTIRISQPGSTNVWALEYVDPSVVPSGMENSTMIPVTISTPIEMQEGGVWEISLTTSDSRIGHLEWTRALNDAYPNGTAYLGAGVDHSFFTYMDPHPVSENSPPLLNVPEPSTYAVVFGMGLAAFGMAGRMHRNTHNFRGFRTSMLVRQKKKAAPL